MISNKERELTELLIKSHDGKHFSLLQEISTPPTAPDDEPCVTEEEYVDICKKIEAEIGVVISIQALNYIMRKDSKLTLWKAKYTHSEDEVFWAIGFDLQTNKIRDVLVNW